MQVELIAITPDAERVIEQAGRTCYMSQGRAADGSSASFVRMLISRGHLSVLEHAYATFQVTSISRACTHQIVRHRLCSFSQRSQRYVKDDATQSVVPPSIQANHDALEIFDRSIDESGRAYHRLLEIGIPREDARFVLPNAAGSQMVLSANFRELRHVIETRGAKHAQWEVRRLAVEMLRLLKQEVPNVFHDLTIDGNCIRRDTDNGS